MKWREHFQLVVPGDKGEALITQCRIKYISVWYLSSEDIATAGNGKTLRWKNKAVSVITHHREENKYAPGNLILVA